VLESVTVRLIGQCCPIDDLPVNVELGSAVIYLHMIATSQTSGHHDSTIQKFWRNNHLSEGPFILAAARGSRAPSGDDKGVWGMELCRWSYPMGSTSALISDTRQRV
jgi:hypothetical protein